MKKIINTPFRDDLVALAIDDDRNNRSVPSSTLPNNSKWKRNKSLQAFAVILHQSLQSKLGITSLFTRKHPLIQFAVNISEAVTLARTSVLFICFLIQDGQEF